MLNEYRSANTRLSVKTVDYVRDAGEAQKVKERYKLNSPTDKNLVIFDVRPTNRPMAPDLQSHQRGRPYPGQTRAGAQPQGARIPAQADCIQWRTGVHLHAAGRHHAKPFKAYFLQGHGEPSLSDTGETGYLKFGSILAQNYIAATNLELFGDNAIPMDCNLLIIAGPRTELSETELQKIDQYLAQGGRLFVLFNYFSIKRPTGLEPILPRWGVNVVADCGAGPANTVSGKDVGCLQFQPASGGESAGLASDCFK